MSVSSSNDVADDPLNRAELFLLGGRIAHGLEIFVREPRDQPAELVGRLLE